MVGPLTYLIILWGYAVGIQIGWRLMDRWLERRRDRRRMINITPRVKRPPKGGLFISGD